MMPPDAACLRSMPTLHLRSLRIQVLLWTILPLIIVLILMSVTGIGSHQLSVRQLVAEENSNLASVAAAAVEARLALLEAKLAAAAQGREEPSVEFQLWRFDADAHSLGQMFPPEAVSQAVARAAAATDAAPLHWSTWPATGQLIWVGPTAYGWAAAALPPDMLDLDAQFGPQPTGSGQAGSDSATAVALLDRSRRMVAANQPGLAAGQALDWPAIGKALAGERGAVLTSTGGQDTVVAYAPLTSAPWVLVLSRPVHDLVAPFFRLEQVLPIILVAVAALSLLTLYFGLSLIVRPLHALVDYAERIGHGDFRAAAQQVGGLHEIEDLRQALDAMAKRLQHDQEAIQDYLRAVTNAQEEERARLARELHDETVQTLIALDHKAQMVQRGLDKHPERTLDQLGELRKLSSSAAQEVRRLTRALRPVGLEEMGLGPALERLAQDAGAQFALVGGPRRTHPETELALFRIAQESLNNIRKHAQAHEVRMMLRFDPATITLGIGDDGIGFAQPDSLSELTQSGHFGLIGMRERAQLVGGHLLVNSAPGCGTRIIVQAHTGGQPQNGCSVGDSTPAASAPEGSTLAGSTSEENTEAIIAVRAWLGYVEAAKLPPEPAQPATAAAAD